MDQVNVPCPINYMLGIIYTIVILYVNYTPCLFTSVSEYPSPQVVIMCICER